MIITAAGSKSIILLLEVGVGVVTFSKSFDALRRNVITELLFGHHLPQDIHLVNSLNDEILYLYDHFV